MNRYKVKDYAVLPPHGPMMVGRVEPKTVGGKSKVFYVMESFKSNTSYVINVDDPKLRPLVSEAEAMSAMVIAKSEARVRWDTWNKRYREYMKEIETGELLSVARVFSKLKTFKKELSYGERKMLDMAAFLIATEVALVFQKKIEDVLQELNTP